MKNRMNPYGKYIEVHDRNMYVSVAGTGENAILLLPGLGSVCPIIEMKALGSYLIKKHTVITIEYLGYGMSDNAATERTIENIVDEIHEAMIALGFKSYSIAAHSLSGLYCLLYTNQYHDEVNNFIGIDTSVPQQIDDFANNLDYMLSRKIKIRENCSIFDVITTRYFSKKFLKQINHYKYSKNDLYTYSKMAIKALKHGSVINELQNARENFSKMIGVKFPEDVNILMLLSSSSENDFSDWRKWHEEILNSTGQIDIVNGMHILHLQNPELIADKIDRFISGHK